MTCIYIHYVASVVMAILFFFGRSTPFSGTCHPVVTLNILFMNHMAASC